MLFTKIKSWLKKNWKWLLFPIGVALYVVGYFSRTKLNVVPSEVAGAAVVKDDADSKAEAAKVKAEEVRLEELVKVEKDHAATIDKLTDDQKEKAKELKGDPAKLNEFLLGIGKDIRG
jgi:predicted negative regulator of RcsB-dependent stress response